VRWPRPPSQCAGSLLLAERPVGPRAEDSSARDLRVPEDVASASSGREFHLIGSTREPWGCYAADQGFPHSSSTGTPMLPSVISLQAWRANASGWSAWCVGRDPSEGNIHEEKSIGVAGLRPCSSDRPGRASPSKPDWMSPWVLGSQSGISRPFASREGSTRLLSILERSPGPRRGARPRGGAREHRKRLW
jgi:hypothetical protein